jgi:hypothetical protein
VASNLLIIYSYRITLSLDVSPAKSPRPGIHNVNMDRTKSRAIQDNVDEGNVGVHQTVHVPIPEFVPPKLTWYHGRHKCRQCKVETAGRCRWVGLILNNGALKVLWSSKPASHNGTLEIAVTCTVSLLDRRSSCLQSEWRS